ncbi:hypothetical protein M218_26495 [Burkholderia pseudomallei MSHR338]|nr:conserved hypothetical protein [Burkholderia pseudomallei Pakistan 9]EEP51842.1 conserved hypothetical protein [Burkholderia pseudomallei MSHR346]EQA86176.1 hypothetical protein M218_26495 [Burkholderia pseudomallei MSHR338]
MTAGRRAIGGAARFMGPPRSGRLTKRVIDLARRFVAAA